MRIVTKTQEAGNVSKLLMLQETYRAMSGCGFPLS